MRIHTDPAKLQQFAAYVSAFPDSIHTECFKLHSATNKFAQKAGDDSVADVQGMIQEILRLLASGEPDLNALSKKLDSSAQTAKCLQAVFDR